MDLFSIGREGDRDSRLLADRMRPSSLDEYIGQEHIIGPGKLLRRAIEADQVSSILLYGPPGCGKTTLAHIISQQTKGYFVRLNAVEASVKDVREVIEQAQSNRSLYGTKTILFLDEVHRFNSSRQDALLPAVENGTIIFIGATTENPFHYVNGALMSRSTLFQLEPLNKNHSLIAMQRALSDPDKGLGFMKLQADEEALDHIATMANGDIRRALNALELAAMTTRLMQAARSILRWMWPRNRYASRSSRRTSPRSMTCCPPFIKAFGVPAMRHCSGSCMRSKSWGWTRWCSSAA